MAKTTRQQDPEARARRQAAAAAQKQREADELKTRRLSQLSQARQGAERLGTLAASVRQKVAARDALASHLQGFYEEIDKLAKGRTFVEATELIVQQANDIIRDAKDIVDGDPFLNRVKEFVPAGNNPVYPDILVTARTIQQCLARFDRQLVERDKRLSKLERDARTIAVALELSLETEDWPSKEDVQANANGKFAEGWFHEADDGEQYFDLDRLDDLDIDELLTER